MNSPEKTKSDLKKVMLHTFWGLVAGVLLVAALLLTHPFRIPSASAAGTSRSIYPSQVKSNNLTPWTEYASGYPSQVKSNNLSPWTEYASGYPPQVKSNNLTPWTEYASGK